MIWQMMMAVLHSNKAAEDITMETQKGCNKLAVQQKTTDKPSAANPRHSVSLAQNYMVHAVLLQ